MSPAFLTDTIILLFAAVKLVPVSRLVGLGIVPGFIIVGVVVGPSVLGLINNQSEITHLAELGVVLLLLLVGVELKPSRLWLMRHMYPDSNADDLKPWMDEAKAIEATFNFQM